MRESEKESEKEREREWEELISMLILDRKKCNRVKLARLLNLLPSLAASVH